jgi:hypothetical protein
MNLNKAVNFILTHCKVTTASLGLLPNLEKNQLISMK